MRGNFDSGMGGNLQPGTSGNFAPEYAHLHSYVAPTDNFIEFKSLDMRERLCFRKARNCLQRGTRARTNDHIRGPQLTCGPISQGDFHCSRS